jgi:hypothetical protein
MLQRTLPAGFIAPCLPTKTTQLPSGGQWLHKIKQVPSRFVLGLGDAISGILKVPSQAARSIV